METEATVGGVPVVTSVPDGTVSVPDGTVSVPAATSVPEPVVVVPTVNDYLLTVRLKITAMDDVEARKRAYEELADMGFMTPEDMAGRDIKLQVVAKNAPPRKVEL